MLIWWITKNGLAHPENDFGKYNGISPLISGMQCDVLFKKIKG